MAEVLGPFKKGLPPPPLPPLPMRWGAAPDLKAGVPMETLEQPCAELHVKAATKEQVVA